MTDELKTEPNAQLAYTVLDLTVHHRRHLDMDTWVWSDGWGRIDLTDLTAPVGLDEMCSTTACFAGWTVAAAGYAMNDVGSVFSSDGRMVASNPEKLAGDLLGLDPAARHLLFFQTDTRYIEQRVAEIFGPRPASAS